MNGFELITSVANVFFNSSCPKELFGSLPCPMLWEAIRREDAVDIPREDILPYLLDKGAFWVFPEPVPAFMDGIEPEYARVESAEQFNKNKIDFWRLVCREPTYIVDCDNKWMIALTTENTVHGGQLCVLVNPMNK